MKNSLIIFNLISIILTVFQNFGTQKIDKISSSGIAHYSQILYDSYGNQLLVGTRDHLLRVAINNFSLSTSEIINWPASKDSIIECRLKGQSDELCRNYIQVLLFKPSNGSKNEEIFVCGTNAFKPICSWRRINSLETVLSEEDGIAKCSYNPFWNTTSIFSSKGIYYFFGSFSSNGHDIAILRKGLKGPKLARTLVADTRLLNHDSNFILSFEKDDFIYFFFREFAIEYMSCGKVIYSRIGRICRNDKGESKSGVRYLTTFVKARLNCSVPDSFPFYLNEIQSAYYLKTVNTVYAIFSTPKNSIHGFAICAFTMTSIESAFQGPLKYQDTPYSTYKPELDKEIKLQFSCKSNLSRSDLIRNQRIYQLTDKSVNSLNDQPLVLEKEPLIKIAVDLIDTKSYENVKVIFVLTSKNRLRRYVLWPSAIKACFISEWNLDLSTDDIPLTIKILSDSHSLVLGTKKTLLKISLSNCDQFKSQDECLASGDPYCAWNLKELICSRPLSKQAFKSAIWFQVETANCAKNLKNNWSPWSEWRMCQRLIQGFSFPCLCRIKKCLSIGCNEPEDIQVTNCTQDGNWSDWTPWTECSSLCGPSFKTRERSCSNPSPQFGGRPCIGISFERTECVNNPPCPKSTTTTSTTLASIKPLTEWSKWEEWEECSVKCGGGIQVRKRNCLLPSGKCSGCDSQWLLCNTHPCKEAKIIHQTDWYHVNYSSDGKETIEERIKFICKAQNLADQSDLTLNFKKEERTVALNWSNCSTKCGKGIQYMYKGKIYLKKNCDNNLECSGWSHWSKWSSCFNGEKTRTRICKKNKCDGSKEEKVACFELTTKEINSLVEEAHSNVEILKSNAFESKDFSKSSKKLEQVESNSNFDTKNSSFFEWSFISFKTWPFNLVVVFCLLSFASGAFFGILITYLILKKINSNDSHQKLRWFKNSKSSNAYVTTDNFKISSHPSFASDCLINGRSLLSSSSTPMLNYTLPRDLNFKRAKGIKAKLNLDQNF